MKKGDLVVYRDNLNYLSSSSEKIGLIVEIQARGPVPGAYILWPDENKAEWVKIESLVEVKSVVSR